jgi:hypothetical protein
VRATDNSEANCAALLGLCDCLRCARGGFASSASSSEFFSVCKHQVHVLHNN